MDSVTKPTTRRRSRRSEPSLMRERLVDAATEIIFERGLGSLTLAATGERVGLKTTSVTHYFKRKDELSSAVYHRALSRMEAMVADAAVLPTPAERMGHYVRAQLDVLRKVRLKSDIPVPPLSGILAVAQPHRSELVLRYRTLFRQLRAFFGPIEGSDDKRVMSARAHVLQEVIFWLPASLRNYAEQDFARFGDRLLDILEHGILAGGGDWTPTPMEVTAPEIPERYHALLKAATSLINEQGYGGASVNKIVGKLNVSKGAFYHHLDSRNDLTLDCFFISYDIVTRAQVEARARIADGCGQLASAMAWLLNYQFSDQGPLLRVTALQGLTSEERMLVMQENDRVASRFSSMVLDGMIDGGARMVDPMIAGHALCAMINAAYVMRNWANRTDRDDAIHIYADTVLRGLTAPA